MLFLIHLLLTFFLIQLLLIILLHILLIFLSFFLLHLLLFCLLLLLLVLLLTILLFLLPLASSFLLLVFFQLTSTLHSPPFFWTFCSRDFFFLFLILHLASPNSNPLLGPSTSIFSLSANHLSLLLHGPQDIQINLANSHAQTVFVHVLCAQCVQT